MRKLYNNNNKMSIPCVILAGGKSSRMGEDKAFLPFGSYDTLIEYQYKKLSQIFQKVYIATKPKKFDFDADFIYDTSEIYSPMVALDSIFKFFDAKEKVFIIPVDTPFLSFDTIESLVKNSSNYDISIAKSKDKVYNLCGVFSCNLKLSVQNNLQNNIHKINYFITQNNHNIITFNNKNEFLNINNQDDYAMAKQIKDIILR